MDQNKIEELQAKYKLTEEEYQQYYHAINLFFSSGKKSERKPKLVFVIGQIGAGKSKLIPVVNEKLNYNAVVFDCDMARVLHPKFELVNKDSNKDVYLALLPDVHRASLELIDYCKDNKLNLIYEGTMRATEGFIKRAKEFREAGYEVHLELLSVPKLESYVSIFLRNAMQLITGGEPRWISKSIHDESYDNFILTLEQFEKQNLFEHAIVYRRGEYNPEAFYSTEGKEFAKPSEAVLYGRKMFREHFLRAFPIMYKIIHSAFFEICARLNAICRRID